MNTAASQVLLTLVASPDLSHELIDWFLAQDVEGYLSHPGSGHSSESTGMSLAEQVTGRRRKEVFHLQCSGEQAGIIVSGLAQAFAGTGIHYWVVPVLRAGRI